MKKHIVIIFCAMILSQNCNSITHSLIGGKRPNDPIKDKTFIINNDASATVGTNVEINIQIDNAEQMCFSNDNINYSKWEIYNSLKLWKFEAGGGEKIVYGKFLMNDKSEIIKFDNIAMYMMDVINPPDTNENSNFGADINIYNDQSYEYLLISDSAGKDKDGSQAEVYYIYENSRLNKEIYNKYGEGIAGFPGLSLVFFSNERVSEYSWKNHQSVELDIPDPSRIKGIYITNDCNMLYVRRWIPQGGSNQIDCYRFDDKTLKWGILTTVYLPDSDLKEFGCFFKASHNGQILFVGTLGTADKKSRAFIYNLESDKYILSTTLIKPTDEHNNYFWGTMNDGGDTILIADVFLDSVYVFKLQNNIWEKHSLIKPHITKSNAGGFGIDCDLNYDGSEIIVGDNEAVPGLNPPTYQRIIYGPGSVYVYKLIDNQYQIQLHIKNPEYLKTDFGCNVSIAKFSNNRSITPFVVSGMKGVANTVYIYH